MVLPKPWIAVVHSVLITSVLLNKMSFFWLYLSLVLFPVTFAFTGGLERLLLHSPQCFPPYLLCIYAWVAFVFVVVVFGLGGFGHFVWLGFFFSFFNSEIL